VFGGLTPIVVSPMMKSGPMAPALCVAVRRVVDQAHQAHQARASSFLPLR
jgi:hypothetical protein